MAPSGGNCQPWRFRWRAPSLWVEFDASRSDTLLDFSGQASHLALGAAIENAVWVGRALGFEPSVRLLPHRLDVPVVAQIDFARGHERTTDARAMVDAIATRATNRQLGERVALPAGSRERLVAVAEQFDAELIIVEAPDAMHTLATILAEGDRLRFYSERLHRELFGELRWTPEEAARTRDGIDVATLELTPTDFAGMQLVSRRSLIEELVKVEGGHGLGNATLKAVDAASAVCRLSVSGQDQTSHLRGGRALQRVWLEATRLGLSFQPLTALLYLFARLERGQGQGLRENERTWLQSLRDRYLRILPVEPGTSEMMLFRLSIAGPPSARSLRRPVSEVLTIES
jgi:nucleotide-binding universal stress UspA family protein